LFSTEFKEHYAIVQVIKARTVGAKYLFITGLQLSDLNSALGRRGKGLGRASSQTVRPPFLLIIKLLATCFQHLKHRTRYVPALFLHPLNGFAHADGIPALKRPKLPVEAPFHGAIDRFN